jgi:Tol biopolymer transport system component
MIGSVAILLLQIQVRDEPKDWKLIETPHFRIYYPTEELLPRAREFAGWFEKARSEHLQTMGVEPPIVNVFLYRSYLDLAQASFFGSPKAQPLTEKIRGPALGGAQRNLRTLMTQLEHQDSHVCRPSAQSRALAIAEPLRDRIFIHCQGSDRWNYWFIKHELAHQVQFQALYSFRVPSWMLALKGPIIPEWWWEGGADYWAGIFDSEKDQYMRDLANERLYDLKELFSEDTLNFYDQIAVYNEGSYFWRFLDEAYGQGTGRRLFDRTADTFPIASQKPVQHVVGKSREAIEREFRENLEGHWAPLMQGRTAPTERLTDSRKYYRRQTWGGRYSPDGRHLAWVSDTDTWPELYVDGKGQFGVSRGISTGWANSAPAWSPDGKKIAVIEWTTNRDQLDLVTPDGGWEEILIPELDELYDPYWSPDGTRIALSGLKDGRSDIYILTLSDRKLTRITDHQAGYSSPSFSKDGKLAYIKEEDGHTILYVHEQGPVTKTWALLAGTDWSPDGKSILVTADVGGVWDAFEVDPVTGKAKRLTKFRGGVQTADYHPTDGSLVITYYQGRGSDLFRVEPNRQDEPGFDEESRKPWYDQFKKPPPEGQPAEKTRVFGVNWLMFPVTSTSLVLPGFEFSAGDRDAENNLTLGGYGIGSRYYTASGVLANTRYRPTVGAAASLSRNGDLFETKGEPFIEVPLWNTVTIGGGWIARYREQDVKDVPDPHFFDSGPTVAFTFTDQVPVHLHDWEWGFSFGGSASFFSPDFGGDRDLNEYFAFLEVSNDIFGQDYLLWSRVTMNKMVARTFLSDELIDLRNVIRGGKKLQGIESESASLEFRFPIYRDLMWKPFELFGLGEWLIIKDLRGFLFTDVGRIAADVGSLVNYDYWAYSVGAGLRFDFSIMLWPILNVRVPTRVELWAGFVAQPFEPNRGAIGGSFIVGF